MKNILIYFKGQKFQLLAAICFIVIPFTAICLYMPVIPYAHYFFLIVLFLIKILVQNDAALKKKIRPRVQSELTKELKRNPSADEIFKRIIFNIKSRDFTLLITGVAIISLAIFFKRF